MSLRTWYGAPLIADPDEQRAADDAAMKIDPRYAETIALVEGTSAEVFAQWNILSTQSPWRYDLRDVRSVAWERTSPGYSFKVGEIVRKPVAVSLQWSYLNGGLVCFWEATSRVVDFDMIEAWLTKKFPKGVTWTNAQNLHIALHAIEDKRAKIGKALP